MKTKEEIKSKLGFLEVELKGVENTLDKDGYIEDEQALYLFAEQLKGEITLLKWVLND